MQRQLRALTAEQATSAVRRHLQVTNAFVAMVDDPEDAGRFVERQKSNAPSPGTYATPMPAEALEEFGTSAV